MDRAQHNDSNLIYKLSPGGPHPCHLKELGFGVFWLYGDLYVGRHFAM